MDIAAIWNFYSNRFILYFTISLNYFFNGTNVFGYHIVNFIIHVLNGIFVYLILNNLLSLEYFAANRLENKKYNFTIGCLYFCMSSYSGKCSYLHYSKDSLSGSNVLFSFNTFLYIIQDKEQNRYFFLLYYLQYWPCLQMRIQ